MTRPEELKKLYIDHFVHRMRSRPITPGMENYQFDIENRFEKILNITKKNTFPDWTLQDLNMVLKSLKNGQSQDTMNFANEIFSFKNIGDNLKNSVLVICNNIKNQQIIPDFLLKIFITSIPKKQKSPLNLEFERGIFLVPKLRVVLVKLIFNSIISDIENDLTNSNIGSRKGKSPRDHLFVVHSVINERR